MEIYTVRLYYVNMEKDILEWFSTTRGTRRNIQSDREMQRIHHVYSVTPQWDASALLQLQLTLVTPAARSAPSVACIHSLYQLATCITRDCVAVSARLHTVVEST